MVNSGINVGWSLFNSEIALQSWYKDGTAVEVLVIQCVWFVGSIVGGFNAGFFIDSMGRKKVIVSTVNTTNIKDLLNY